MEGSENEVTSCGRGQGQLNRLQIAQFADEQNVGVFTQCSAEGVGKRAGMNTDLAVLHEAVLAAMHEFNRILHRDDVVVPLEVGEVHHGGKGGGFSRAGGAGNQNETFLQKGEFFQYRRQSQIVDRQYLRWNQTKDRGNPVFLLEEIGAITGDARHFVAKVNIEILFENFDLGLRRDLINHGFKFLVFEGWIIHPDEVGVDPQHRRIIGGKVEVGRLLFRHQFEISVDLSHAGPGLEQLN